MTKDEALRMALEALEVYATCYSDGNEAITAIREVLAQPEPAVHGEPVASIFVSGIGEREFDDWGHDLPVGRNLLYTTPQPAVPELKPLTDEEIEAAMPSGIYDCLADPWDCGVGDGNEMRSIKKDVLRIARAIEAAHGIKGDA